MKWIRFVYDKAGEMTERFGLEFGPDQHGNISVYQIEPKVGLRSFKPFKMFGRIEVISPWWTETYARRLARMRAPLYSFEEKVWLGNAVFLVVCIVLAY